MDHDAIFRFNRLCGLALQAERGTVVSLLSELPVELAAEVVRRLAKRARERAEVIAEDSRC